MDKDNNSIDDIKLKSIEYFKDKKKAGSLETIEDKNHPVYWSEEYWQEKYFNENPQELLKLEMFKNHVIEKYEEQSRQIDGWEEVN